ncbi:hypothetical protein CNMCM6106_002400 [Aspergillus hiratsukae]|uniref:AAA+ ATPase domain-containing protein n=1 Tax=Aspergillus hiratsukae TaxID=1194566 RepID=A0A8H6Q6G4_9EURO|nr:hypothetical protein CNMCM6106_002400 [Aspergillus hiratsukae]
MACDQDAKTEPPSQVTGPPNSPSLELSLRGTSQDNLEQFIIDAIRQVLLSVDGTSSPGKSQLPIASALLELLEALQATTSSDAPTRVSKIAVGHLLTAHASSLREPAPMGQLNEFTDPVIPSLDGAESDPVQNDQGNERVQASKPDFQVIWETYSSPWNEEASKYKTVESTETEKGPDYLDEYVFVVRNRIDKRSGETTTFMDIKSEALRDSLRVILRSVRTASLIENKLSIEQKMLFHFLPELQDHLQKIQAAEDPEPKQLEHLALLAHYMKDACASTSQRVTSLLQRRPITYDLLWPLFKPEDLVYTTCFGTGKPRCVIFEAGEEAVYSGVSYYELECRYLDFDGQYFGEAGIVLRIKEFRGAKEIDSLEAFPLSYHRDSEQHSYAALRGRVGVDAAFFREMRPNYSRPRIRDICQNNSTGIRSIDVDFTFDFDCVREKGNLQQKSWDFQRMTDHDYLICSPTVRCFSFKEKTFLECAVSDLHDVDWCPESFHCLQIPQDTKQTLLALATTRLGRIPTVPFDDVIKGKGRGINILLHGPTGVGKTFTVEATAEWFKLPLYSISAAELTIDHGDLDALESRLDSIFKVAKHFNAVLLLDEADAFMEQRTSYLDEHNRLLTVFLRNLEYYEVILFLTSNRAIEFDDAILSRIHLKIKYGDLTMETRREIWKHFLSKAHTPEGPSSIEGEDLYRLESLRLNGHQIKNLTSVAHALATFDGRRMSYEHLEMAAKLNEKFADEFGESEHLKNMYM